MSMLDYEKAAKLVIENPHLADFVGPRPKSLIEAAEQALSVHFPPTYRRFLVEFGAGGFGSEQIYGVVHENFEESCAPDGIWWTLQDRKNWQLPPSLIAIYDMGDGEVFYLDLATIEEGEAPVIVYDAAYMPEEQSREIIANDFGEFFFDLVQDQIAKRGTP